MNSTTLKMSLLVIALLLAIVIVVQNARAVTFQFLFWEFAISQILLTVICLILGFLVGILIGWRQRGKKSAAPQQQAKARESGQNQGEQT